MRLLHTADWHFGRTLEGRSRQGEHEAFADELVRIAEEESIDAVLIAGDVYDSVNPPAEAETLFYETLQRLSGSGRRPVAVIAGNHDHPDRLSAAGPLALAHGVQLAGLPTSDVLQLGSARTGELAMLYALPYPSESRLRELLSAEADEEMLQLAYSERIAALVRGAEERFREGTIHLIMSHLYALGGAVSDSERPIEVGGAYTVDPAAFGTKAQYVALGHLHRPQAVRLSEGDTSGRRVRYSGSPLAFSFSEAGQAKSVSIVELAPGGVPAVEEIPLSSGRPLVRWRAAGGLAEVYRWIDEGRDARAWIELEVCVTEALSMEQIQTLRRRHDGIALIRPVFAAAQDATSLRAERSLPIDEMFRRFYTRQTGGAEADEALVKLFLELIAGDEEETGETEGAMRL